MTDYELPREELGFSSTAELLQRVPNVEMRRPPNAPSVMVFHAKGHTPSKEEEEKKKKDRTEEDTDEVRDVLFEGREKVIVSKT